MLINGKPRQACTALLDEIVQATQSRSIQVAPLSKFPLVRDLIVDRTRMFDDLKRVHAWIETEEIFSTHPHSSPVFPQTQKILYSLSKCMTCGCCLEACPQINARSSFIGPAAIAQVRLFDANPLGQNIRLQRIRPLREEGGVSDCGHSQNCVRVCPKEVPLTDSIASLSRTVTRQALRDLFSLPDSNAKR
jgi:succinate dehydrogenase / fumarate reductase iron-sulfur subunit